MYVSATEFQNNFGKYLKLCAKENVFITKNGRKRALLLHYPRNNDGYEAGEPVYNYGTSPRKRPANWVTYQEFMEMTEKSDNRYELIDGVVYMMPSPGFSHQNIIGKLHLLFHDYFTEIPSCAPYLSPFDTDLIRQPIKEEREITEDDINVVQPDLLIICDPEKDINEKDRYKGTPELVVEILSPSTRSKDTAKKTDLYMESGIKEFWLIDPENECIQVYRFKEYEIDTLRSFKGAESAESVLYPGLKIHLEDVFGKREEKG